MVEMTQLEEDCKKLDSLLTVLYEINDLDLHELDLEGLVILLKNISSLMNKVLDACEITTDKIYLFTAAVHHFNKATKGTVKKLDKKGRTYFLAINMLNELNIGNQKFFGKFMARINEDHKTKNDQHSLFSHENAIKDDINPLPVRKELQFYKVDIKDIEPKFLHTELIKLLTKLPDLKINQQLAYIAEHITLNSVCYGLFLLRCSVKELIVPLFELPEGLAYVTDHWFKLDDSEYYYQVVMVTKPSFNPLTMPLSVNYRSDVVSLQPSRSQNEHKE